jgi:hypothetical protein
MLDTFFSLVQGFYIYLVEVPIVLGIVVVFLYVMYSLNLFRKE